MTNALDIAKSYIARGWNPVPVPFKSKKPTGKTWQLRVINVSNVAQFFNGSEQNVGVLMGRTSGGLVDVDLDCPEAIAIAALVLPKTDAIFGRPSARFAHWIYRSDLALPENSEAAECAEQDDDRAVQKFVDSARLRARTGEKATLVEIRIGGSKKGAQTVFPGSTHESDELISWEEAGEPALVRGDDLIKKVKLVAVGALLIRYWPGLGAKHDAALAVGGFMARAGYKPEWIQYFVERIARAAGCSDVADKKKSAFDSATNTIAGKKTFGLPTIKELFGEHVAEKIADWLEYKGAPDQAEQHEKTPPPPPADPVDLWAKFDPPSLPRNVLPQIIEDFAFDQGMAMGCDMSGLALSALAVCAAAIPDQIQIQPKRHDVSWLESARLWVSPIGPPSAMKTPMIGAAVKPLRRIDAELARRYQSAMAEYNKLTAEDKKMTVPPKHTRVMIRDVTIEAAQEILKDSPDGVLCFQDELSGWFGSMDKYSGARAAAKDRGFWMESYQGGSLPVDRIGRGSILIENLSVSILGGIQPEPIRKIAKESVDDGLLQRLIPIVLQPAVVGRDEVPSGAVDDYDRLVNRLHNLQQPRNGIMRLPTNLRFDEGALVIRESLERKHLELQQVETINPKLASHIGKYNGIFARLCVVFHCVDHSNSELPAIVPEATAKRAAALLHAFLLPHALAFYAGTLGLSNDHDRLTATAGYILAHKLERVTNRDVQRGDRTMRKLERRDIESLFEQLDALGWVTRTPGPRPTDPPHWIVSPAVHIKFAERARTEEERRRRERAVIAGIMNKNSAA